MQKMDNIDKAYSETMDYLYSQLPMFQRVGKQAFKKDLTNITTLTAALDNPHQQFKSIHLAGTNGKGSTAFLLAAALQAQGLKVGLYVSPHYKDFRERIRINGELCSKSFVVEFTEKNKSLYEGIQPSFFEITVAMAFSYFAAEDVDIAIIETGLGGRLDSTNIINPLLSVITNIGFDHVEMLGNTLPLIAGEKAGIIKANTPVVIGKKQEETKPVFDTKANEVNSTIHYAADNWSVEEKKDDVDYTYFDITHRGELKYSNCAINIHGSFQAENLRTALAAIEVLENNNLLPINWESVLQGWKELKSLTNYIGRWQIINTSPLAICDSAHNADGLRNVLAKIETMEYGKLHFVFGMVNDKSPEKVLTLLPKEAEYYFAKANIPRGLDAKTLQQKAAQYGLMGKAYTSVKIAYKQALENATINDLVYVGGSIFVVAEVL